MSVAPYTLSPDRIEALQSLELLATPPERSFDRLTGLVRRLLNVPVSLVSLVADDHQFFKSSDGLPEPWATMRQTPLSHSFCQHVVESQRPLIIEDARNHALVRDNLAIRDLNVIAYLGIPLSSPDGHVIGSLCAIDGAPRTWSKVDIDALTDLAALATTEIALRFKLIEGKRNAAALLRANDSKDRLFSIISHDLRSPMGSILMMAQTLTEECGDIDPGLLREFLMQLTRSAEDLYQLLENLLLWSRLQTGGMQCQPMRVDLENMARFVVSVLGETARRKNIALSTSIPSQAVVWADPDMLRSVLLNLVSNAIKFTRPGGVIKILARPSGERLIISVEDTGVGMTAEQQCKVLTVGGAVPGVGTDGEKGSGLGLQICHEMIALQGSSLSLQSKAGIGTTASFSLCMLN